MNSSFGNGDAGDGPSRPSSGLRRDRFMGKPSSEVLADLQDQFDREREMFFQNRPSFGDRDFTDSPFRRRFFQRSGRFSDPTQPDMTSFSSSAGPEEDPFDGQDSIPIKVTHEYTTGKPPKGATPSGDATKLGANADGERTLLAPQKSASAHDVQPARKQPAYQKSSSAGVKSTAVCEPIERSLSKIASVEAALSELSTSLDAFSGAKSSKDYIYLDEMLTRNLIRLDDVETYGNDEVRSKRKATVKKIQSLVEKLETKASENSEDGPRVYDPTDEGTSV